MENRIKCKVKLSKQLFPKEEIKSGEYAILSVKVEDVIEGDPKVSSWGTITIVGNVCEIDRNEIYTVIGNEVENDKYGIQYEIIYIGTSIALNSKEDQKVFLSKILTENQVENLFLTLEDPIKVIDREDIEKLCSVKGIGVKAAINIVNKYNESKDYSLAYVELNDYGLTNNMINKLIESYGSPNILVKKIKENPYIIADEVDGIGWNKADEIALKSGYEPYSVNRIKAYIEFYLNAQAMEGNSYVEIEDLLDGLEINLGEDIPTDNMNLAFKELAATTMWHNEDKTLVGLKKYYELENNIASELIRLLKAPNDFNCEGWEENVKEQERIQGWEYTFEQMEGIKTIINNNVILIGGSAGTGKTSAVSGVLSTLKSYSFAQTALSGKASVNLTDVTGEEGYTIHRLLGYNPSKGFVHDANNKLDFDIIILDELSMVDGNLFYRLIQSIKDGAKLIMLGDTGQLESIGVANIMQDLIDSEVIPYVELTKIHRQAAKSAIITDSMKIRKSEQITDNNKYGVEVRGELQDLIMDIYKDKTSTFEKVIKYTKDTLKDIDNIMDFQILVPMKNRGDACTFKINLEVQKILREKKRGLSKRKSNSITLHSGTKNEYKIFEGDKVINIKNNYNTVNKEGKNSPIFNGNLGTVKEIDNINKTLLIDFENIGQVIVPSGHIGYIELGYAITVHKSQGSGFKTVICALDYSHFSLLNKEMVYTMLTRTKKKCYFCVQNKALRYAINRSNIKTKQTFLSEMLKRKNKI